MLPPLWQVILANSFVLCVLWSFSLSVLPKLCSGSLGCPFSSFLSTFASPSSSSHHTRTPARTMASEATGEEGCIPPVPAPMVAVEIPTEELNGLRVADLKAELKGRSVPFSSKLKKQELKELLQDSMHLPVVAKVDRPPKKGKKEKTTWNESHPARKLLLDEIRAGRIPLSAKAMGPAEVYYEYSGTTEFKMKGMDYGSKFKSRLKGLRKQVKEDRSRARADNAALKAALKNYPVSSHDHRGRPQWNGSVAQALLEFDISIGKHKNKSPLQFRSERGEIYKRALSPKSFRWKVQQIVRTQKYLYTLKHDAEQKLKAHLK